MIRGQGDDLSVIVCGPIEVETPAFMGTCKAAVRLRGLLPRAEIILVTWEACEASLSCREVFDNIVFLKDPGPTILEKLSGLEVKNNFARMVLAAFEGGQVATRRWLLRMRADCVLETTAALEVYSRKLRSFTVSEGPRFQAPMLVPSLYTRNPRKGGRTFHPSDLLHLGLREDFLRLFGAAIQGPYYRSRLLPRAGGALNSEQMIWLSFLNANGFSIRLAYEHTADPRLILLSEKTLCANFMVGTFGELGLRFKKPFETQADPAGCYTPEDFERCAARLSQAPLAHGVGLVTKAWWQWLLVMWKYKVMPLCFDWSPPAKAWKASLLRKLWRRLG